MAREITEQDLANKGVSGLPDVPGLTTEAMQKKFDEISKELLVPRFNEMAKEVNEVNENLTANEAGTEVDLSGYTSSYYTTESDGYLHIASGNDVNSDVYITLRSPTTRYLGDVRLVTRVANQPMHNVVFVKKGMKLLTVKRTNDSIAQFIPFINE